jgi:hypothetical protein
MVITQKMIEKEMGYRGSKSEFLNPQPFEISVKEQRVDGSCCKKSKLMQLRCTLTGGESRYQIKIPSKQINNRSFSTLNLQPLLNQWFITGFSDAEGCFTIKIQPNAKLKTKWRVRPVFSITLHLKDLSLLKAIQNTLGVGKINKCGKKAVIYAVDSVKEIPVILNHFDKYPLITHKLSDYLIFKQCFEIIKQGEHLTERGLLEIISLKSSLNLGLPDYLKNAFPNIMAKDRPEYFFKGIPDPFWVSGFISGDGSFQIVLRNSNNQVFARLGIHLHVREIEVLKGLATYFKLYNMEPSFPTLWPEAEAKLAKAKVTEPAKKISFSAFDQGSGRQVKSVSLQISKFYDIVNIIIPFFNQYPIVGTKSLDFKDFKKVCDIIKTKEHLTSPSVFNQILKIKSGMNLNRK